MTEQLIDDLAHRATSVVTRRHPLLALGGAALAANAASRPAVAAESNDKKKAKKAKKKLRKRCNQQKARCRTEFGGEFALAGCCESCYTDDLVACYMQFSA